MLDLFKIVERMPSRRDTVTNTGLLGVVKKLRGNVSVCECVCVSVWVCFCVCMCCVCEVYCLNIVVWNIQSDIFLIACIHYVGHTKSHPYRRNGVVELCKTYAQTLVKTCTCACRTHAKPPGMVQWNCGLCGTSVSRSTNAKMLQKLLRCVCVCV